MAVDNKGLPYNSSGYGENGVDIAAPGVNVKTTLPDDEETLISGTSVQVRMYQELLHYFFLKILNSHRLI